MVPHFFGSRVAALRRRAPTLLGALLALLVVALPMAADYAGAQIMRSPGSSVGLPPGMPFLPPPPPIDRDIGVSLKPPDPPPLLPPSTPGVASEPSSSESSSSGSGREHDSGSSESSANSGGGGHSSYRPAERKVESGGTAAAKTAGPGGPPPGDGGGGGGVAGGVWETVSGLPWWAYVIALLVVLGIIKAAADK